jgi:PAS domain S-box-containing protein
MDILPIILGVVSGICIGSGLIYLLVGLRRRDDERLHLTFALFALAYAGAIATSILAYKSASLEAYMIISRGTALFTVLTLIMLLWFVSTYTKIRPRVFLIALTAVLSLVGVVAIFRTNFIHTEIIGLVFVTLPWGETIALLDASESIWEIIFFLSEFALIVYMVYACIRQFMAGERRAALSLGVGLFFLIFALIFDIVFIDSGMLNFIYLGDYGFLPLLIVMSVQLTNQILRTEDELALYRQNLENMVSERTAELEQVNEQLNMEISSREQVEKSLRQSERRARALLNAPPDTAMLLSPEGIILETNEIGAKRLGVSVEEAVGSNVFELFEPSVAELRWKKAEEALASKQAVRWEDERDGKHYANNFYPILDENEDIISLAVFAANITGRKKVEEALRHKIEDLNILNQVGHVVTSAMDMPVVLQRIAEIISGHYQARYSHIILQEDVEDELMILVGFDRESGIIKPTSLDLSLGSLPLVNDVMTTGESLVISDPQSLSLPSDVRDFLKEHHIQGVMLIPLRIIGAVSGIMVVSHDQSGRSFTTDEVLLAETIADDVSRAVEIARLQEQEKNAAATEERSRLARDLHDAVTQTIYSASLIAEVLPTVWERNPTEGQRNLVKLRQLVRGALAEMRTLLFELRPASLEAAELTTLLRHLGDALTGRTRIPVSYQIVEKNVPPVEVKIGIYRITQEALNNIAKHSEATQVTVELQSDLNQVKLTVRDDGRGFDQNNLAEDKLGIQIMTERANEIDARLELNTTPGKGTQISITWPGEEYNNAQTLD